MVAQSRDQAGGDDEHDPEGVPLSSEWARVDAVAAEARARLDEVDAACARLERGTYGFCRICGEAIPLERLRIRPYADVCVPCGSRPRR
ncbi:TraR/DksA C4-type zinc finger protein [Microbacterium sp. NC79]|nr:TraR/DksA C4-type zinc finger protein [Microbacterium sp. NC79]